MKGLTGKVVYYSIVAVAFVLGVWLLALFVSPESSNTPRRIPLLVAMIAVTVVGGFFRWLAKQCNVKLDSPIVLGDRQRMSNWIIVGVLLFLFGFVSVGALHVAGFAFGIYVLVVSRKMTISADARKLGISLLVLNFAAFLITRILWATLME